MEYNGMKLSGMKYNNNVPKLEHYYYISFRSVPFHCIPSIQMEHKSNGSN
jgi:hypothetical protein